MSKTETEMLRLEKVSKTFGQGTPNEKCVLNEFSLTLNKGEFVTIIGSNGAGKSTTFSVISGAQINEKGMIFLDGENITFEKEHNRSKSIGRVFQDPLKGTAPNMTIEENLSLAYLRTSEGKKGMFSRVNKTDREFFASKLKMLGIGLESRLGDRVGLLSGGQRQALTLLMATLVSPKLLLLDEHTAALDPETASKILSLTQSIVEENQITCMMITHNIAQALSIGSRTIMMHNGEIIFDVSGEQRKNMTVEDILQRFQQNTKESLATDRILLS